MQLKRNCVDVVGPLLGTAWIFIFQNNCIFPYYGKCLTNTMEITKTIYTIEFGKSRISNMLYFLYTIFSNFFQSLREYPCTVKNRVPSAGFPSLVKISELDVGQYFSTQHAQPKECFLMIIPS